MSRRRPRARSASIADEREAVRLAAELHQVGRLVATAPEDVTVASERIVSAAPSLAAVARLLRAIPDRDAPLGARIVAVAVFAAEHGTDALHKTDFDPALVEAVTGAQPVAV